MFCKNCGTEISNDSKFCYKCGERQDNSFKEISSQSSNVETENEIKFEEELYKLKVLINSKNTAELLRLLTVIVDSKENGDLILRSYSKLYNRDLIEDLKNLSNSYDKIKSYVQKFIEVGLIEPNFPHQRLNEKVEPINKWKAEALKPNQKKKFPLVTVIISLIVIISLYNLFIPSSDLVSKGQHNPEKARIGNTIEVGNFLYRVNNFEYRKRLGNQFVPEIADGIFLVIDLSMKNQDNKEHTLDNSFFRLEDDNRKFYNSSRNASTALEMSGVETLFLKQCNPNIQKQGYLVFEVPSKGNYSLHLSDGLKTAIVRLEK